MKMSNGMHDEIHIIHFLFIECKIHILYIKSIFLLNE